jgi:hypothetical protein
VAVHVIHHNTTLEPFSPIKTPIVVILLSKVVLGDSLLHELSYWSISEGLVVTRVVLAMMKVAAESTHS